MFQRSYIKGNVEGIYLVCWDWRLALEQELASPVSAGPGLMEALSAGTAFYGFIMDLTGLVIKMPVF